MKEWICHEFVMNLWEEKLWECVGWSCEFVWFWICENLCGESVCDFEFVMKFCDEDLCATFVLKLWDGFAMDFWN